MRTILTPKKFKKSLGWLGFIGFEVLWQNGQNLANFFLSTTLQVPILHQQ
jgi:hypothetical protein